MFTFKPASKTASNGDGRKTEIGKTNGWLGIGNSQPKNGMLVICFLTTPQPPTGQSQMAMNASRVEV